ncbi:hypothetical protein SAMN05660690_1928 [Geodermatophilus telluris]|uniref:Uncharacterized protein n=1 Tax=Geodermatophilus telluris TaxID=1190417 RepID=A0A1G6MM43_9ACTN|nr:hypothetical protein [Geodermatophilus telluris]SDC56541.1 hypothetical protein SAMN05660690_1928 [Geodermatophilus telluris]
MSAPVDHPSAPAEEPRPATEASGTPAPPTEKRGIEERGPLLFAAVVAFIVLAFVGMIVLTALGGGTDYVPWGE